MLEEKKNPDLPTSPSLLSLNGFCGQRFLPFGLSVAGTAAEAYRAAAGVVLPAELEMTARFAV